MACMSGSAPSRRCVFPSSSTCASDPYERADEAMDYNRWRVEHAFALVPAQAYVGRFLATFRDFPPRQKAARVSLDQVMDTLRRGAR